MGRKIFQALAYADKQILNVFHLLTTLLCALLYHYHAVLELPTIAAHHYLRFTFSCGHFRLIY